MRKQVGTAFPYGKVGSRYIAHFAVETIDGNDPSFCILYVETDVRQRFKHRRNVGNVWIASFEEVPPEFCLLLCHERDYIISRHLRLTRLYIFMDMKTQTAMLPICYNGGVFKSNEWIWQ